MTQQRPMETIHINIDNKDGTIYISSDDVPGLWLWGKDAGEVFDSVIPTVKALYEYNQNIIVEIKEAPDRTREERWSGQDKVCQTYQVFKVGNTNSQITA